MSEAMDYKKLADLLFPDVDKTPEYYLKKYPKRNLKEGAEVTRFAPSPTGYMHIGGVYQSLLNIQADDISGSKPLGQDEVVGVPKFYGVGELPDCYYMIIDFLGPNLLELFNYCGCKKFTISTICLIALQVLNRIENIHKHHYLHRDIKPENFLIGIHEKSNVIYS